MPKTAILELLGSIISKTRQSDQKMVDTIGFSVLELIKVNLHILGIFGLSTSVIRTIHPIHTIQKIKIC